MALSIVRLIREKSTSVGLSGLIRLEAEDWLFALTGWIPAMTKFLKRHNIRKCFASLTVDSVQSSMSNGRRVNQPLFRHILRGYVRDIYQLYRWYNYG
jgi:hypothetical protein